jgi:hypothetical protein
VQALALLRAGDLPLCCRLWFVADAELRTTLQFLLA